MAEVGLTDKTDQEAPSDGAPTGAVAPHKVTADPKRRNTTSGASAPDGTAPDDNKGTPKPGAAQPAADSAPASTPPAGGAAPAGQAPAGTQAPANPNAPQQPSGQPGAPGQPGTPGHQTIPGIPDDVLQQLAPIAVAEAPVALAALPMLAQALSGLLGGGGGGGGGNGADTGTGNQTGNTGSPSDSGTSTPLSSNTQAQKVQEILQVLQGFFGKGTPQTVQAAADLWTLGNSSSGYPAATHLVEELYQYYRAAAYNDIDSQLTTYLDKLIGNNKADQDKIKQIIAGINTQLDQLGPAAYTSSGQSQVNQILADAIQQAEKVTGHGQLSNSQIAAEIDNLTGKYVKDIAGENPSIFAAAGTTPSSGPLASLLDFAKKYIVGKVPYVWGGESMNGFDCSGLVQYLYSKAGIHMPRVADDQSMVGQRFTNSADLRPGDLIFSAWPGDSVGPHGIGHVAIYAGNGQIIEAPQPGQSVHQIALSSGYMSHVKWFTRP